MPNCIILAGPNGAGKTTASRHLLPGLDVPAFVNADHIAVGLSGFNPESVAVRAGRLLLDRVRELAAQGTSFAFATTLATRIFAPMIRQWRTDGYRVSLLYFYLPDPAHCLNRVAARVAAGGHHIQNEVVDAGIIYRCGTCSICTSPSYPIGRCSTTRLRRLARLPRPPKF